MSTNPNPAVQNSDTIPYPHLPHDGARTNRMLIRSEKTVTQISSADGADNIARLGDVIAFFDGSTIVNLTHALDSTEFLTAWNRRCGAIIRIEARQPFLKIRLRRDGRPQTHHPCDRFVDNRVKRLD